MNATCCKIRLTDTLMHSLRFQFNTRNKYFCMTSTDCTPACRSCSPAANCGRRPSSTGSSSDAQPQKYNRQHTHLHVVVVLLQHIVAVHFHQPTPSSDADPSQNTVHYISCSPAAHRGCPLSSYPEKHSVIYNTHLHVVVVLPQHIVAIHLHQPALLLTLVFPVAACHLTQARVLCLQTHFKSRHTSFQCKQFWE